MTKAKTQFLGTDYTIVLDASFDLYSAGVTQEMDYEESYAAQQAFARKFREAADRLEAEAGIDICILRGSYDGPIMQDQSDNGDEGEVWQAIHDRCK